MPEVGAPFWSIAAGITIAVLMIGFLLLGMYIGARRLLNILRTNLEPELYEEVIYRGLGSGEQTAYTRRLRREQVG